MANKSIPELIAEYKALLDSGAITEEEFQMKKQQLLSSDDTTADSGNSGGALSEGSLSARTTGIVAYLTWIGFIIALLLGDRKKAMFHINQALIVNLFALLSAIPFLGWIWSIFMIVCWIMGIVYACREQEKEVPLIGKLHLLN